MTTSNPTNLTFYVIAKKNLSDLSSPLVGVGDSGDEASLIFTEDSKAQEYLQAADWTETDTVAELDAAAVVSWLAILQKEGVKYLVPDPDRVYQDDGMTQTVITISSVADAIFAALRERLSTAEPVS
ncbi:hypothetical protein [Fuerstiella marisgermanici]|uniref:DUF2750 domain-containing protein n=1 Tax=Fuerstiella marisgermanici TaxID=1891926 RepID=A0A1P8WJE3_9PLAN|nr:hypothetical protein [Fuerstiella marisgermanici]APZ94175.1 hypothetical protein Fuma_03799 [Fuerstiella marisgermanici]